ncbi:beta-ketoacyl-ACP synthase II [Facilibium subflavum]|uniref:beta-ketoacyl-ACP synthase II n=1 Tax=Facilibium subflavum TaxID=2219058 RepID=UPI000E65B528|nr:beta-ketoacyl-ACP synthase II [Facilibium subflavum]
MKSARRVVITGLGAFTPLGKDVKSTWDAILKGQSGIDYLPEFDVDSGPSISEFKVRIGGTIKDYNPTDYFNAKELKKYDLFMQYGFIAAEEAWQEAGITVTEENAPRIGVSMSSGIGGLTMLEQTRVIIDQKGPGKISPFCIPATIINLISGNFSIKYGLRGPNTAIVTACTTGTHNIGMAARMIAYGDADVMVAGGADKANTAIGMGGFAAARALSTRNDDPQAASRPWDKDRDGFVLSNGAAAVVLEEYEHAKARGAKIYGEIIGYGMNADAYHITNTSGVGGYECMKLAIEDAQIPVDEIDYINAHGTSTPAGDVKESQAVEKALGAHAKNIIMSSTKSMTGHMLGAAGAIEAIFSLLAIRDQVAPPTINLDNVDDDCNLDYAAHEAKPKKIHVALSNSFGFGGTNGSLIFKKI